MENLDRIGLAIIGCGTIGRIRAKLARQYPGVDWLGLCDVSEERGKALANDVDADFFTTDAEKLVARPEVNAVMVLTDENNHTKPALLAIEAGHKKMFIEKPLATDPRESAEILEAITKNDVDARIAYTQRFRRRFLTIKERLTNGQIGDVHSVVTRAFMNRMVPIATIEKTTQRKNLTPMVVSGTHSFDMSMWLMEGKTPESVYARSTAKALADLGTKDSTFGLFTMSDGTIPGMVSSMSVNCPRIGIEPINPLVYGWSGVSNSVRTSVSSTTSPAYMTATRSAISATTPRSWVMRMTAVPDDDWRSRIRSRI